MERFSDTSDLELADGIVTWSGRIAAGEAELLALIGEFDHREAWGGTGLLSCAHRLSWRTSLSPTTAREKVRVAAGAAGAAASAGGVRRGPAVVLPGPRHHPRGGF